MPSNQDDDNKNLLCRTYSGERGAAFETWKKLYIDAAEGKGDDEASWAMCCEGTDPQIGLTPAQVRKRDKRRRESRSAACRRE